jgi:hypothetical protein
MNRPWKLRWRFRGQTPSWAGWPIESFSTQEQRDNHAREIDSAWSRETEIRNPGEDWKPYEGKS